MSAVVDVCSLRRSYRQAVADAMPLLTPIAWP